MTITADAGAGDGSSATAPDSGSTEQVIPADILFVVDTSGSMADEQDALAANIHAFIAEIAGTASYHIGVVSTDLDAPFQIEGWTSRTYEPAPYYEVSHLEAGDCRMTTTPAGCFRPVDGRRFTDSERDDSVSQIGFLTRATRMGTCGSGLERTFDATLLALDNTRIGSCNAGFIRPEANLVLVYITDEDEVGPERVAPFLATLSVHKSLDRVRLAVIAGTIDGAAANCGGSAMCGQTVCALGPPTDNVAISSVYEIGCYSCSYFNAPDCCNAVAANTLVAAARQLEAEVAARDPRVTPSSCAGIGDKIACRVESICEDDFHGAMVRIARDLVRFQH